MTEISSMRREIEDIPSAVARLLAHGVPEIVKTADLLRRRDPLVVATIARGSSDHAASYLKYAIELTLGLPVASIGPSIASIYERRLRLPRAVVLAVSQSGGSPDIVAAAEAARAGGATVIALTNTPDSALARAAEITIDLCAGTENSVAATKSFVASVVAGLMLIARWSGDSALGASLPGLPQVLANAISCDWSALDEALARQPSLYVLGRGPGMAIASEVALKFKETCSIQAEAYSSAEVAHGPRALVTAGYPVLALAARDAAEASVIRTTDDLVAQGANAFITSAQSSAGRTLPFVATGHSITDALPLVVSFYAFVEALARRRGLDPDRPPHLLKVTRTL